MKEVVHLRKQNTKLQEENNLLKYKVEILLDMVSTCPHTHFLNYFICVVFVILDLGHGNLITWLTNPVGKNLDPNFCLKKWKMT